jgi:hypothetical protein
MINPKGGDVAIGTIMYDSTLSCVRVFKPTGWSNCLCDQCGPTPNPVFTLDCSSGTLSGTFTAGTQANGTKIINYTNATGQSYSAISVASSGVSGLIASSSAGTWLTEVEASLLVSQEIQLLQGLRHLQSISQVSPVVFLSM